MSETIPVIPEFLKVGMRLKLVKCTESYSRRGLVGVGSIVTITRIGSSFINGRGFGINFMFHARGGFSNKTRTWEVLCE